MRKIENKLETTRKMVDLNPTMSIITLNINGLSTSNEEQKFSG